MPLAYRATTDRLPQTADDVRLGATTAGAVQHPQFGPTEMPIVRRRDSPISLHSARSLPPSRSSSSHAMGPAKP